MFKVFPRLMCLRLHQFAPNNRVAAPLQVYMPSTISILSLRTMSWQHNSRHLACLKRTSLIPTTLAAIEKKVKWQSPDVNSRQCRSNCAPKVAPKKQRWVITKIVLRVDGERRVFTWIWVRDVSCEERDGQSGRNNGRKPCTWKAWLPCVFVCGAWAHRILQSAIDSSGNGICKVFHL